MFIGVACALIEVDVFLAGAASCACRLSCPFFGDLEDLICISSAQAQWWVAPEEAHESPGAGRLVPGQMPRWLRKEARLAPQEALESPGAGRLETAESPGGSDRGPRSPWGAAVLIYPGWLRERPSSRPGQGVSSAAKALVAPR